MAKAKRRKARKHSKRNPFTPAQLEKARATRAAKSAERAAATAQTKALVKQQKAETQAKLDALKAEIASIRGKKPTVKGALKATKEATRAAKQAKKAQAGVEKLRTGLEKRMAQVEKAAKKTKTQEKRVLSEAKRVMGIGRIGKAGKRIKHGGKRRAGALTAAQLTQLAGLSGAARTAAIKKARKQIMKAEMAASRPKRRGKAARRTAAAWGKQMRAAGMIAERMPAWPAGRARPPKPTAPRAGFEGVRHLAALDSWRPYVKGKGTPGWYWTPPRTGGFKYHKNPKKRGGKSIISSTLSGIKKFFGIKKGKRNPSTGAEILKNAVAGTGAFVTGRLIGNLAARSGWFSGSYEKYVPVASSVVNVLVMHLASGKVDGLKPYRTALLTGAGIQLVETMIDAFAPANVNALFDRPGGMGADLNVYEAALQDDLGYGMASDEELLAGVDDMGEYLLPAEEDMGEYLSTEEDMSEYVSLNDDMGEYVSLSGSEDELADEAINELMGAQDDLAEELTEMGDEVLADEVLADDMADDLGDDLGYDLGAEAAPAPAPFVVAVPENVRKRGAKAVAAYRRAMSRKQTAAQRKAARLARASGHPAGGAKGQILTGVASGGVFGQMAAAPKKPAVASKVRWATRRAIPRVTGAVGTPAHFAQVQAQVAQATGAPPAAALVAYRAETAGPQAALRAARRMGVVKGPKARVIVRRGTGGMLEFTRPTTKRALHQPRVRSVYEKPLKEDEQGVFKGDIFSGDRI
jgi:hypothetical protein